MRTAIAFSSLVLLTAALASAQQVATVTSSAPFTLRGAGVNPGQGVPTFPVMPSDAIKAGNALTIVTFRDGTAVTLDPGSEGSVEVVGGRPVFRLLSGRAEYRLQSLTALGLAQLDQPVTPTQTAGVLVITNRRSGGFWTPRNTTLVLGGAGGAAGLGVGLGRGGGPPVSPARP